MKPHDLSELSRELAALTPARRRERLIHYLESEPESPESPDVDGTPGWFDQLMATSFRQTTIRDAAKRFANSVRPSGAPLRLPSDLLRQLRFRGEEKEARVLAENLTDDDLPKEEGIYSLGFRPSLVRANPEWIPGAKHAWERAKATLEFDGEVTFLIARHDPGMSVRVLANCEEPSRAERDDASYAVFSPAALSLPDPELTFLVGAALAEMLFDHDHYRRLLTDRHKSTTLSILPAPVEAAGLRWSMKAPITTDRAGLVACGSLATAIRALLRSVLGLPPSALPVDDEDLLSENALPSPSDFPLALPTRFEAMRLYAESFLSRPDEAVRADLGVVPRDGDTSLALSQRKAVDEAIEQLFPLRRPITDSPRAADLAEALAAAGMMVLAADGNLEAVETRILIESLFLHFTDEPEILLQGATEDPLEQLNHALEGLCGTVDQKEAEWLLARLVEVALADGRFLGLEAPVISRISEVLGLTAEEVSAVIERVTGRFREDGLPCDGAEVLE